jgi:hypothetical protein
MASSSKNHQNKDNSQSQSQSPSWSLLRVLCLHDARSNSLELSATLDALGEKLYRNHGIDLVFVDAPLIVDSHHDTRDNNNESSQSDSDSDGEPTSRIQSIHHRPPRAWWEDEGQGTPGRTRQTESDEEKNQNPNTITTTATTDDDDDDDDDDSPDHRQPPRYLGLDASLLLLKQVWNSSPFWGILAVGQAAGVSALLPLLPNQGVTPPSFMIFINGKTLLDEEESLTEHLNLPCLHIVDNAANIMEDEPLPATTWSDPTQRLVRQFGGKVVCDDESSFSTSTLFSSRPSSRIFNNQVGRFLVARKRHLRRSVGEIAVLALKHELHRTEADAAQLVAQHIANNPPDALMAVITPKDVGGFRDRRRGFGEEGGGAPCPSEFLLHRAKRSGASNNNNNKSNNKKEKEGSSTSRAGSSAEATTTKESPGMDASRHHPSQQKQSREQQKES